MTTLSPRSPTGAPRAPSGHWAAPADLLANLGPNWFASVMGTGIVATAAALLPVHIAGLSPFAVCVWVLAAAMLIGLTVATAVHWARYPVTARSHVNDPAMAPFYGAVPMAVLTVGSGALLVGHQLIGMHAAVVVDGVLWTFGAVTGVLVAVAIPYLMITRHRLQLSMTLGSWLMPIVGPVVAASAGSALIGHLPAGQDQQTMLWGCYALCGASLIPAVMVITLLWGRLVFHGPGPAVTVPTVWIVLGPLGQSVTAVNLLGAQAGHVLTGPGAATVHAAGLAYGVPVWGAAMLWLAISAAITISAARRHLPFSLSWWSFTFPVGTVVTGTSELAIHTGLHLFDGAAVALYALLVVAWAAVACQTLRHSLTGRLSLPAGQIATAAAVTAD